MYEVEVKVPADLERVRDRLQAGDENEGEDEDVEESTALAVTPAGTVMQTDTYYDAPHRTFAETDEALRIRRERRPDAEQEGETEQDGDGKRDAETRVTYKGPLVDDESKTREEAETAIGDGETFDTILTNLGFGPAATVRKERERFTVTLENAAVGATTTTETGSTDQPASDPAHDTAPTDYTYTITLDAVDDVGEYVEVETEVESEIELESARAGAYTVLESLGLDPDDQLRTSYLGLLLDS